MKKKQVTTNWAVNFKCPGGDCGLTCCSGKWKIALLEKEIENYKNVTGEFKQLVEEGVDFENGTMRSCGDRCSLLDENGFCKLVLAGGEDLLSITCQMFPRRPITGAECENVLVDIACPLVAKNMLDNKQIEYYEYNDEAEGIRGFTEDERTNWNQLEYVRNCMIEILQYMPGKHMTGKSYILNSVYQKINELYKMNHLSEDEVEKLLDKYSGIEKVEQIFNNCERIGSVSENKALYLRQLIDDLYESKLFEKILRQTVERFPEVLKNLNLYLNKPSVLFEELPGFIEYMQSNYPMFSEKFFQYAIFESWTEIDKERYGIRYISRILEHTLINLCAMAVWHEEHVLDEHTFSVIISAVDRGIDHSGWDRFEEIFDYMNSRYTSESFLPNVLQMLIV